MSVRLRVAVALVCAADKEESCRQADDMLADLPRSELWRAEEILHRVAGRDGAQMEPADDPAAHSFRDAWKTWWKDERRHDEAGRVVRAGALAGLHP
ncbi:MAG: hypothetical protein U0793_24295 [Gemmataceae bacterium]